MGESSSVRLHVMHVVRSGRAEGGMENGVVNVANRLPADRYKISICALDSAETFSTRIQRPDSEFHLVPKQGSGIDWGLIRRLARVFKNSRTDLVHSHNWGTFLYAVLAAKLAGLPIVHGEHGKNANEMEGDTRTKYWAKKLLTRYVDRVVTVSQEIAKEWTAYGLPPDRIQWIPNGVDTQRFHPRADKIEARRKFGLPESGLLIGSIGRQDPLKAYDVLLDAFGKIASRHPDTSLALLGRGPCHDSLVQQAEVLRLKQRIFLLGHHPDPEDFLAGLDVFVLPSRTEGMSNVVLEAMASGLPVVCADLPCHHEVFTPGEEGMVVSPITADSFADVLRVLLQDEQHRWNLGRAARAKAAGRFALDRMISDYDRLYSEYRQAEVTPNRSLERLAGRI